jgi:Ca2+-binding EF-hand superfamily protein
MGGKVQKLFREDKLKNIDMIYEKEKIKYGEIDQFFYKYDEDGDNYLTEIELITVITNYIKVHPEKEENLKEMIDGLEVEANSLVSLETFRILMSIYLNDDAANMSNLVDIFKTFDKNCSGLIEADEVSHVFNKLGMNMTKKEAQELVDEANLDGDSGIDLDEFSRLMISK